MPVTASLLADQIRYTRWASHRLLTYALTVPDVDITRHIGNSHGDILNTFQHIYYGDRIWFSRLNQTSPPRTAFADPDPGPSLQELGHTWWPLLASFEDVAQNVDPMGALHYTNLKGESISMANWQAILHVVNHGTYHRGQIAAMLRQQGHHPPPTDLIYHYLQQ